MSYATLESPVRLYTIFKFLTYLRLQEMDWD